MPSKVRVYGKAQNRTVLGIVNAYLVMYPHATKADLVKAFPLALQDGGSWKSLFCTPEEWKKKNELFTNDKRRIVRREKKGRAVRGFGSQRKTRYSIYKMAHS